LHYEDGEKELGIERNLIRLVQSNAEASVSPEKNGKVEKIEKTEKVTEKVTDKKVEKKVEKVEIIEDEEILEAEGKFVVGI
jgi:hypothetical protein